MTSCYNSQLNIVFEARQKCLVAYDRIKRIRCIAWSKALLHDDVIPLTFVLVEAKMGEDIAFWKIG